MEINWDDERDFSPINYNLSDSLIDELQRFS